MKVKTEAFWGAVIFGLIIQLGYIVISTLILYNTYSSGEFPQTNSPLALLGCSTFLLTGIGIGLLYAYLHNRKEDTSQVAIKGGAVSSAVSYAVGVMIMNIVSAIVITPVMNALWAEVLDDSFVVDVGIGPFYWVVIAAVLGAVLGAIGGAIGGAVFKSSGDAPPPSEIDEDYF